MNKILAIALLAASTSMVVFAGSVEAPEIDASAGTAALTLLTGGMLVLRSRRKR